MSCMMLVSNCLFLFLVMWNNSFFWGMSKGVNVNYSLVVFIKVMDGKFVSKNEYIWRKICFFWYMMNNGFCFIVLFYYVK